MGCQVMQSRGLASASPSLQKTRLSCHVPPVNQAELLSAQPGMCHRWAVTKERRVQPFTVSSTFGLVSALHNHIHIKLLNRACIFGSVYPRSNYYENCFD